MNILIRSDASSSIGTGHVMRDLVLAKQYPDSNIIFATQEFEGNLNTKIKESGYDVVILHTNSVKELIAFVHKYQIDKVIIDHYDIDYIFEKELKEATNVKLMVLDDTYEKHYCDILLNHNISAQKSKYINLVPKYCDIRCGKEYTLLRQEFIDAKKIYRNKRNIYAVHIFLSMGGVDTFNYNLKILKILKGYNNIKVLLTTTTSNKNLEALQEFSLMNPWVELHINSTKIAQLMSSSHFAIITPSVTVNEALYLELPFISFKVVDNQSDIHEYLKNHNFLATDNIKNLQLYVKDMINEFR